MATVGVLNWVSKFHVSTDSEHKFHKMEIEIGYPLDPVWDRLDYEPPQSKPPNYVQKS